SATSTVYYSSIFDINEGYVQGTKTAGDNTLTLSLPNLLTSNNNKSNITVSLYNNDLTSNNEIKIYINNNLLLATVLTPFNTIKKTFNITNNILLAGNNTIKINASKGFILNEIIANYDRALTLNNDNFQYIT